MIKVEWDTTNATKKKHGVSFKKTPFVFYDEFAVQCFDGDTLFNQMANEKGVPYQSFINIYLRDFVLSNRKIAISWQTSPSSMIQEGHLMAPIMPNVRPHQNL